MIHEPTEIKWPSISERKLVEKIVKIIMSYDTAEISYHKMVTGNYLLTAQVDNSRSVPLNDNQDEWDKLLDFYQSLDNTEDKQ